MRSNQESTNLRTHGKDNDVTAAETFRTAQCMTFAGHEFVRLVEQAAGANFATPQVQVWSTSRKNSRRATVTTKRFAQCYAYRSPDPRLWFLSPYEFSVAWEPRLATYPLNARMLEENNCHASLTSSGVEKMRRREQGENVHFQSGLDYRVKATGGEDWVPITETESSKRFCHEWVLVQLRRP